MSKLFGRLFSSRNRANKENMEPLEESHADWTSRKNRKEGRNKKGSIDDQFVGATACYRSVGQRRAKGPKSCPGGYKEDAASMLSFATEFEYEYQREQSRKHDYRKRQRRDEKKDYRSPDLEISDDDDDDYEMSQIKNLEAQIKHYEANWRRSEERHQHYRSEYKKLTKTKEDAEQIYIQQIKRLNADNAKLQRKIHHLENLNARREVMPPAHNMDFSFRMQQMNRSHFPDNTPSTSAMDSHIEHEGDSMLLQPMGDISLSNSFVRAADVRELHFEAAKIFGDRDEVDEMKNFRNCAEDLETPRVDNLDESRASRSQLVTLLDDGYHTCSTTTPPPPTLVIEKREE